jgi:predicted DNA binding protein
MSITAQVHIEHEQLSLGPTLRALDGIKIRVVSQENTDPGATLFPFFIEYEDRQELERMLEADETVAAYELVDWTGERGIYYIEHTQEAELISSVVTDVNGFLLHTETRNNGWLVRLLLPDKEALSTIWEYAVDRDIKFEILEIYENQDAGGEASFGLTDQQEEALIAAYRRGYFNEPRDVFLDEIAQELGLSSTAMSGRLRRGMRSLIAATLMADDPD